VLLGNRDFWSNGVHLNTIEAAESPAAEAWANINAIDDLVYEMLNTHDKVVISAIEGNAGAGGVAMAAAADHVITRDSSVLNMHYKNMGLYGSEYWTHSLPKRVG
jgi:putative two-component system protein, hydrogenase maturation factor HypX/HoxX